MSLHAPFVDAATSVDPTNEPNTHISYYTWGAGLGLGLDLALRSRFPGVTLDDYMRAMWRAHGKTERPYTPADLKEVLAQVTGDRAFTDGFFRRYVEGREVMDYGALLAPAGLLLRPAAPGRAYAGESVVAFGEGGAVVGQTLVGTPLYEAGLDRGDRIVSLGGRPVESAAALEAVLAAHRPGDTLAVEFETRGGRRSAPLVLAESPFLEVVTFEKAGRPVTAAIRAFRERWLGSKAR